MPEEDHVYLHRHPHDTEVTAAERVLPQTTIQREAVFRAIAASKSNGMTDSELQEALDLPGNSERPRRGELVEQGRVRKTERRRPNLFTGNPSIVWQATTYHSPGTWGYAMDLWRHRKSRSSNVIDIRDRRK